ncbi:glycosyl hydrolase family 8 [Methylobacterium durans]|uniref:glycosyl hydrolase family 8 n=1 Tax=Methylobacterium durans TaxID=2202825 RepID=UPI002AFDF143|nr:glycosyl hydrolase family 8 [Methylobacterium durans]MEA1834750.1 glycosyl hydrolase family 8 [Methylobacterium durans]
MSRTRLFLSLALSLLGAQAIAEPTAPPRNAALAEARRDEPAAEGRNAPESVSPLFNALGNTSAWLAYKARFVTDQGRVVDTGNGQISHSEGQGYGMLLAVAAGDRDAFQRIWNWTRANLMVRDDSLLAWRWEPDKRPGVADTNNATDGDILVAWALVEAADAWSDMGYRVAARRIAVDIGRRTILFRVASQPLLPGMSGFSAEDRADGPVANLSYWIFPAFPRLATVAGEIDWAAVTRSGLDLLAKAQFGPSKLPTEWISMRDPAPKPAAGFPAVFSYNSIRIPLYLAWAGITDHRIHAPFSQAWAARERTGLPVVDTADGQTVEWMQEPGYEALSALEACAVSGEALPASFAAPAKTENYYPATLHLLALVAVQTRFKTCLGR